MDSDQNEVIKETKINQPNQLTINTLNTNQLSGPGKDDASIQINITGGTPPYSYRWNNGAIQGDIYNLPSGKYSLTVTDMNGCEVVGSTTINKIKLIPNLVIDRVEIGTTLRLENLFFEADSTVLKVQNHPILDEIYDFMTSNPEVIIEIGGHTNTIPPHEYCDELSSARARNVAFYLYQRGISEKRLSYKGYGKRNPLTNDRSIAGRKRNQRVEIKILSK